MFDWFRERVLQFMRVPAEPTPPAGAPGSVQVFRAGKNYLKLRLLRWGVTQVGAAIGIVFSLLFIDYLEGQVAQLRAERAGAATQTAVTAMLQTPAIEKPTIDKPATAEKSLKRARNAQAQRDGRLALVRTLERWPAWIFPLMHLAEYGAILFFLLQIPFSYSAARLEFEQHWYIVTDRSLRIRSGLVAMQESTMSFANLQQVVVQQGPLQRLLGLADVQVQSAGGGGRGEEDKSGAGESLHRGVFHCVENAPEIRDLMLERLRRFRETGLGDPDDPNQHAAPEDIPPADTLAAARELLAEARALRASLG